MIRRRLVVAISVVAAIGVVVAGTLVLFVLENRLVDNLDRDFRATLSGDLRDVIIRNQPPRFGPDRPNRYDPIQGFAVVRYDAAGQVEWAIATGRGGEQDPLPAASTLDATGDLVTVPATEGDVRYRTAVLRTDDGGTVAVARSMATIDQTVTDTRRILVVVGVGAIAGIAVVAWVVVRRAFSPIDGMIATADRIAAGDLAERTGMADERSEVERLGSALDRMMDRIESAIDAKSASEERMRRFVAEASHELRTPLTSVRGYAELYRQGADDPEAVRTSMERIESEATRMSRLVEAMLQLARLDREPGIERGAVDPVRIAGESVDAARVVDGARAYDLDVDARAVDDTPVALDGDRDQLRQVLDNLLTNARLHTPPGTTVTTTVSVHDGTCSIVVADDGPGFSADDRRHAFDRFWRSTRTDENPVDGTGLGLAIVRSIVEAHGGAIVLDDTPGGGARFTITLPLPTPPTPPPIGARP